jgi:hypothetical protein
VCALDDGETRKIAIIQNGLFLHTYYIHNNKIIFLFSFSLIKKKRRGKGWAIFAYRPIEQVCKKTKYMFLWATSFGELKKKNLSENPE